MGRRSKYDASFKTKVVIEALKERETLATLCQKYGIAAKQITAWKAEFVSKAKEVFASPAKEDKEIKELRRTNEKMLKKVGQLTVEVVFFAEAYGTLCRKGR